MKKILIFAVFSALVSTVFAQGEIDLYRLSQSDPAGSTAHNAALGGAMGALGGDASAVATNPAGLAVYNKSEVIATVNFAHVSATSQLNDGKVKDNNFGVKLNNLSYVASLKTGARTIPVVNVSLGYHHTANYDRRIANRGSQLDWSMSDYIASQATGNNYTTDQLDNSRNDYNPFTTNGIAWLPLMAYDRNIIRPTGSGTEWQSNFSGKVDNSMSQREWGSISNYDFGVGFTISKKLSVGAGLTIVDLGYDLNSDYTERHNATAGEPSYFKLTNYLRTQGSGAQLKIGAIYKIGNALRVGAAYHSPRWMELYDTYSAILETDAGLLDTYDPRNVDGNQTTSYTASTPDKWVFSAATTLAKKIIFSADFELINNKNQSLSYTDNSGNVVEDRSLNEAVDRNFKWSGVLHLGAEMFFNRNFSGRLGFVWKQSPYSSTLLDEEYPYLLTAGTTTQYDLLRSAMAYSAGLGYIFNSGFFCDAAIVVNDSQYDFYNFPESDKNDLKQMNVNGLITLGYRF